MRCKNCPLCPEEDFICEESEGEYGLEHADGECGCRHPKNWAIKKYKEYLEIRSKEKGSTQYV